MLNSDIATVILDGLFAMGLKRDDYGIASTDNVISFAGNIYLGLLTKLPNDNGIAYEDGTYFTEPNDPTYLRIRIDTQSRINKKNFIAGAATGDVISVGEDNAIPAYVTNQGAIMFPEASVAWDKIVGFGLFRSGDKTDTTTLPFLWGAVTTENGETGVTVEQYEVPVIRQGGFKVSLV